MSSPRETTPLRGMRPRSPRSLWYIVPYSFLLFLFLLCNVVSFVPRAFIPRSFLPDDSATLKLCVLVVANFVARMCWLPLGQVLEYAGSAAIGSQPEPGQRRAIRKSESVNALAKALLKLLSFIGTIRVASDQLGFWFILPAIAYLVTAAGFTAALVKVSRAVQKRRANRDDAL